LPCSVNADGTVNAATISRSSFDDAVAATDDDVDDNCNDDSDLRGGVRQATRAHAHGSVRARGGGALGSDRAFFPERRLSGVYASQQ
jgi:hypothetical protein